MVGPSRKRPRVIEGEPREGSLHPVPTRILQFEDHPIRATVVAEGEKTLFVVGDI